MDVISLALSKDYTEASLTGAGALKGDKGDPGPQGPTGPQGLQGEQGPVGPAGPQGEKGDTGAPGAQGIPGPEGPQGDIGPAGFAPTVALNPDNTGDIYKLDITDVNGTITTPNLVGRQGEQGIQGERGETGPEGPQGIQGIQGIKGDKGEDGYPFLIYKEYASVDEFNAGDFPEIGLMFMVNDGVSADKPVYRYTGETDTPYSFVTAMATSEGLKGDKGDKGDQGEQGVAGPAGADGVDGITYTPRIGTVQGVEAMQDANATVDVDTVNNLATYNFWLPRGPVGQQGLKGETGEKGEAGTTYTPSIGTIETVDSTLSATASVEIDADTKAAKFNFALPRGEDGKDGFDGNPAGTIAAFAGTTPPIGYLLCDGRAVSRTDYADLFAVIGETYGAGDGSTTFNVPDLSDKFLQGAGINALGTAMSAGLPNIEGEILTTSDNNASKTMPIIGATFSGAFSSNKTKTSDFVSGSSSSSSYPRNILFNASASNAIYGNSDTVQPPALVVTFVIKATNYAAVQQNAINDAVVTNASTWSSKQIEERITNGVADTGVTAVAFNTTVATGDASSKYVVRNGVCYVTLDFTTVSTSVTDRVLVTGLPSSALPMSIDVSPYNDVSGTAEKTAALLLSKAGNIQLYNITWNRRYMCSFSYPVA